MFSPVRILALYISAIIVCGQARPDAELVRRWEALTTNANQAYQAGRLKEAAEFASQAADLALQIGVSSREYATSLHNLAEMQRVQGNYATALSHATRAVAIREEILGPDDSLTAMSLTVLAWTYAGTAQYDKALEIGQRVVEIYRKVYGPEHPATGMALNDVGGMLVALGRPTEALPLIQQSVRILTRTLGPEHMATMAAVASLADTYRRTGDFAEAIPLFKTALAFCERVQPESPNTATVLENLAGLHATRGDHERALQLYERALTINRKALGDKHRSTARSLNNIALTHRLRGDYSRARALYEAALATNESALGTEHPDVAKTLNNLAQLFEMLGDAPRALATVTRALKIQEKALPPNHPDLIASLTTLAEIEQKRGNITNVISYNRRCLAISRAAFGASHPETATSLNNLGMAYLSAGDVTNALPLLTEALDIRRRTLGDKHAETGTSFNNLAGLYHSLGRNSEALPLFQQAATIRIDALGLEHPDAALASLNVALTSVAVGRVRQGCQLLGKYLADTERLTPRIAKVGSETYLREHIAGIAPVLGAALECSAKSEGGISDERLYQHLTAAKGRVLREASLVLEKLRSHSDSETRRLIEEYSYAAGALAMREQSTRSTDDLQPYRDRHSDAYRKLVEKSRELRDTAQPFGIKEILGVLPKTAALIDIFQYENSNGRSKVSGYAAFLLRADKTVRIKDLGPSAPIDRAGNVLIESLPTPDNKKVYEAAGRQLYEFLIAPLAKRWGDNVTEAFLVPDGPLQMVPWYALRDSGNRYLPEGELRLVLLGSARDLVQIRRMNPVSRAADVVFAAPDYGQGALQQLEGARMEAAAVKAILPSVQMFIGSEATRERVLALTSPRILHIATHGTYQSKKGADSLSGSMLAFTGANAGPAGWVTARELAGINLQGTQLVTLSGCETGLGEHSFSDGLIGFQRALTIAGARTQLLSLWKIDDTRARDFIEQFYTRLLGGDSRAGALRAVQRELISKGRPPSEWAAFVMFGDPGTLNNRW